MKVKHSEIFPLYGINSSSCDDVMSLYPGLDRSTYWLIKMNYYGFLFSIVCGVVTIACLIFQLRLFTQVRGVVGL